MSDVCCGCFSSPEYKGAIGSLLRQFKGSFRTVVIPCYVASGATGNPGELPYRWRPSPLVPLTLLAVWLVIVVVVLGGGGGSLFYFACFCVCCCFLSWHLIAWLRQERVKVLFGHSDYENDSDSNVGGHLW